MPYRVSLFYPALRSIAASCAPAAGCAVATLALSLGRRDPTAAAEDALLGTVFATALLGAGLTLPRRSGSAAWGLAIAATLALTTVAALPPGPTRGAVATTLAALTLTWACARWSQSEHRNPLALAAAGAAWACVAAPAVLLNLGLPTLGTAAIGAALGLGAGVLERLRPGWGFALAGGAFALAGGATVLAAAVPWFAAAALAMLPRKATVRPRPAPQRSRGALWARGAAAFLLTLAVASAVLAGYPWMRERPLDSLLAPSSFSTTFTAALRPPGAVVIDRIPATLSAAKPTWSAPLEPLAAATPPRAVDIISAVANAVPLSAGTAVATVSLRTADGTVVERMLRYGEHTGEWAAGRQDLRDLNLSSPPPWAVTVAPDGTFFAQRYRARWVLPVDVFGGPAVEIFITRHSNLPEAVSITIHRLEIEP